MQASEPIIEFSKVNKWYGQFHVLRDIDLSVARGERIVICGPSGSGKSTMIRCINRLEEHQKGRIVVDGIELTNDLKRIDEVRREVGMVFQHFNLFPHLTIQENCTLAPIWVRKMPKKQAEEVAMHFLKRVKIPEQANKYPGQLSGGQQQRVAIGGVLAAHPRILVLDEPTSALDPVAAEEVLAALTRLVHDLGLTVLLAEHRLERVVQYADRVVVVEHGQVSSDLPAAAMATSPVSPPIVNLGRLAGWSPLPLSVRDARRAAGPIQAKLTGRTPVRVLRPANVEALGFGPRKDGQPVVLHAGAYFC